MNPEKFSPERPPEGQTNYWDSSKQGKTLREQLADERRQGIHSLFEGEVENPEKWKELVKRIQVVYDNLGKIDTHLSLGARQDKIKVEQQKMKPEIITTQAQVEKFQSDKQEKLEKIKTEINDAEERKNQFLTELKEIKQEMYKLAGTKNIDFGDKNRSIQVVDGENIIVEGWE